MKFKLSYAPIYFLIVIIYLIVLFTLGIIIGASNVEQQFKSLYDFYIKSTFLKIVVLILNAALWIYAIHYTSVNYFLPKFLNYLNQM